MKAKIKEIFESIQGEGLLVGKKQVFIRFAGCNLKCAYCDTDCYDQDDCMGLSEEELFDKIKNFDSESVSLTGGEPLLQTYFIASFLAKYKKYLNKLIFLETNGTLVSELKQVIDFIDIVGMDIKIQSATNEPPLYDENDKFLETCGNKAFIKVVFDENIRDDEINEILNLAKKYNSPVVLQPKTPISPNVPWLNIFNKFYAIHKMTMLVPQTHKMLGIN